MSTHDAKTLVHALLDVNVQSIIPLTADHVAKGCKVFGAAILRKSDLSLVIAGTNNEVVSPLLHGEINTIQQFYALPPQSRPAPTECVFYATHEPCSLCLSGITWSGFDNVYYLFTHTETSSSFAIPHDIRILEEVFKVPIPGETREQYHARPYYNKKNAFLTSTSIEELSSELAEDDRKQAMEKAQGIRKQYAQLSEGYQKDKGNVGIPLA